MELDIMGLLGACSYVLDCVEAELTHVATKHGKRVAYMSVCTAQKMGITGDALQDLAACSLLHDNALTQYIYEEFHNDLTKNNTENITSKQLGIHCIYGEENLKMYAPRTFYYHELGFWCQKVAHNLAIVKLHKVGTRFVTLGEN